jgi:hypothetical protein
MRYDGRCDRAGLLYFDPNDGDAMMQLFGLTLPATYGTLERELATELSTRMEAAAAALTDGAPVALAASYRQDAQKYLDARRRGELRFGPGAMRSCDEGAWTVMRLTVDTPPMISVPVRMVA